MNTFKICFVFLLLIIFTACDENNSNFTGSNNQFEASESFNFTFQSTSQIRLSLSAVAGSINIIGTDIDSVYVTGTKKIISNISQTDADNRLSALDINATSNSTEFSVETDQPQETEGRQYLVDYEITIPSGLALNIIQVAGSIEVESIYNSVDITSVSGDIDLSDIHGNIVAGNVSGSIDVSCEILPGGVVSLSNVTGSLILTIPTNTSATFQANIVSGDIELHNLVLNNSVILNSSVTGILGAGNGSILLQGTSGAIDVIGI